MSQKEAQKFKGRIFRINFKKIYLVCEVVSPIDGGDFQIVYKSLYTKSKKQIMSMVDFLKIINGDDKFVGFVLK